MIRYLAPRASTFDMPQLAALTRTSFPTAIDVNRVDDAQQGPCVAVYLDVAPAPATLTAWRSAVTGYTVTHPTADETAATAAANQATVSGHMTTALTGNDTYIALASPSTVQNTAQIKALTRQVDALIRLALGQLDTITDS